MNALELIEYYASDMPLAGLLHRFPAASAGLTGPTTDAIKADLAHSRGSRVADADAIEACATWMVHVLRAHTSSLQAASWWSEMAVTEDVTRGNG